jgi:queuosine precursor transporter
MMDWYNIALFIAHKSIISMTTLFFLYLGKEALTTYISVLFVIANIFVIKQIQLGGYNATGADAFIIGVSFSINLLQEYWGKEAARKAIIISFACSALYLFMTFIHLAYLPATFDTSQEHFVYLMQHSARIIIASFVSYTITQTADTYLYAFTKKSTGGKFFVLRNYISMFSSQLFDTVLFSCLGLYGIVNNLLHIIVISYLIKVIAVLLSTPFMIFARKRKLAFENK